MTGKRQTRRRRKFGSIRQLPSKKWQATYKHGGRTHTAPTTFRTASDASAYLSKIELELRSGMWVSPEAGRISFADYSRRWLDERTALRPRTVELYEGLLRLHLLPAFGEMDLNKITLPLVRSWNAELAGRHKSTSAKAYRLLKQILGTAVDDDLLVRNPCRVKGAGNERPSERPLLTHTQVALLIDAMREDLQLALVLEVWVGLRRGEILALQRRDFDLEQGTVRIERSSYEVSGQRPAIGPPKTKAGIRTEHVPRAFLPMIHDHLDRYVGSESDSFLFQSKVGGPMRAGTLHRAWTAARKAMGLEGFTFHDGRHVHLTTYGALGATEAELLARGGHSNRSSSKIYQHANPERQEMLAEALSRMAEESAAHLSGSEKSHGSRTTPTSEGAPKAPDGLNAQVTIGAGDGNRTRVLSLGS